MFRSVGAIKPLDDTCLTPERLASKRQRIRAKRNRACYKAE